MSRFFILVLTTTVLLLGACDSHRPVGAGTEGDAGVVKAPGIIGTWVGSIRRPSTYWVPYAEKIPTQVRITIAAVDTLGVISGTVVFGPGSLPPFNPDVGYLPIGNALSKTTLSKTTLNWHLQQGFSFPIRGGTYKGSKVTINLARVEQWKKWCDAQKAVTWNGQSWSCSRSSGNYLWSEYGSTRKCWYQKPAGKTKAGPKTYVDCSRELLCRLLCLCNAQKCSVPPLQVDTPFEMTHVGDTMKGQVLLFHAVTTDVELTRQ